jgi:hypothetical protein
MYGEATICANYKKFDRSCNTDYLISGDEFGFDQFRLFVGGCIMFFPVNSEVPIKKCCGMPRLHVVKVIHNR